MASPHHHHHDYYESIGSARSPGGIQHQQSHPSLHRAQSRHFETFTAGGLYTAEDHAARYDTNRFESRLVSNYPYEASGAQTWNPGNFNAATMVGLGSATGRIKTPSRQRAALPSTWIEQASSLPAVTPMPGLGNVPLGTSPMRTETVNSDPDEELIPTAIVIKNIPFAVKKEQLVQLMTDLQLPLPYAFNYHFDNGVFRGLAFANFTTPEETAIVIEALNHFDLQGRKLRVEYKKMLPLVERERIEREKRERRGQLEEQHRPLPVNQLAQPSILPATSPTPSAARVKPGTILKPWSSMMELGCNANVVSNQKAPIDVDLNDPQTLQFYSQLLLFRDDASREALIFPPTLTPQQRRTVHTLAHHMGLAHVSRGSGEQRQVQVFRAPPGSASAISPAAIPAVHPVESQQRRTLARATTMDFSDARSESAGIYSTIGRSAHALLDIPASPSSRNDLQSRQNLRAAKSFADLRSYTPSPVPSSASFPATLSAGISRYTSDYGSVSTATPSLTPTATGNSMSPSNPSESLLVNGLAGVSLTTSLGGNLGIGASLREARDPRLAMEREQRERERESQNSVNTGLSGGTTRSYAGYSVDDSPTQQSNRGGQVIPLRQPRGPDSERGAGFGRNRQQNHRTNSGELDVQSGVEIVVE